MRSLLLAAVAAGALLPPAAYAQTMPGMAMPGDPGPAAKPRQPAAKVRSASKHSAPRRTRAVPRATTPKPAPGRTMPGMAMPAASPAVPAVHRGSAPEAQDAMPGMDMHPGTPPGHSSNDGMAGMAMPPVATTPSQPSPGTMPGTAMPPGPTPGAAMAGMGMAPGGAAVAGSGTARLPAAEGGMTGLSVMAGPWMLMVHGYAWGNYTDQGGPRGRDEAFVASMVMLEASRPLSDGIRFQARAMLSLDPAMGPQGYPNLFATGETADGVYPLVDRQHPHDLFMELSGRLDVDAGPGSLFVYGGPVAEPALGPSAFMHRSSAEYLPLSPITHHWFDSTHISYGVVTAGYAAPHWQLEASGFRGREPDQHRWNLETPALDSWSVRATWNPSVHWSAEVSHGHITSPEQLEPLVNENRTVASLHYAVQGLATTFGYALKDDGPGRKLSAWLAEARWGVTRHDTLSGRIENLANDELFPDSGDPLHRRRFRVSRFEAGYARTIALGGPVSLALGGALAAYAKPVALDAAYGRFPVSYTLFAKLSLGH